MEEKYVVLIGIHGDYCKDPFLHSLLNRSKKHAANGRLLEVNLENTYSCYGKDVCASVPTP